MKSLKVVLLLLLVLITLSNAYDFWVERGWGSTIVRKKSGKLLCVHSQELILREGAWTIPARLEEKLSLRLTIPRLFKAGIRSLEIEAWDNDLIIELSTTKPLKMD